MRVWTHGAEPTRDRGRGVRRSRTSFDDPSVTLSHNAASTHGGALTEVSTCPFAFDARRFSSDDPCGVVCARDCFDGTDRDSEEIRSTGEDTTDDSNTPDAIVKCLSVER